MFSQAVYATGIGQYAGYATANESSGMLILVYSFTFLGSGVPPYLFVSGQLGIVPSTNEFATGDNPYHAQTVQAMKNIGEILKAAHGAATFNNSIFYFNSKN